MLNAGDIADLVIDLGFLSPRIAGRDDWGGKRVYVLSYGPPGYRQTMLIEPNWDMSDVRARLEASRAPVVVEATYRAPEMKAPPAAVLDTGNGTPAADDRVAAKNRTKRKVDRLAGIK